MQSCVLADGIGIRNGVFIVFVLSDELPREQIFKHRKN